MSSPGSRKLTGRRGSVCPGEPAGNRRDLTGKRFGKLVAVSFIRRNKHRRAIWACICDCGQETEALIGNLLYGKIKSCGCLKMSRKGQTHTTHGMHDWPEYHIWIGMRKRCSDPSVPFYHRYGGRGIRVQPEWDKPDAFPLFIKHVGRRPSAAHSIDRIDNDGNYETGNVRWATAREQSENSSVAKNVTFGGKTQCMSAWARELGVPVTTIFGRFRRGWSAEKALTNGND